MADSQSIGEQLQRTRTSRKLSLRDVTKATKIQPWILEALEEDRLHTTMSPVYVKGFLSTYAKFLELDAGALVGRLAAEHLAPASPQAATPEAVEGAAEPAVRMSPGSTLSGETNPDFLLPSFEVPWPLLRRLGAVAVGVIGLIIVVKIDPLQKLSLRLHRQEASLAVVSKKAPPPPMEAALHLEPTQPLELAIIVQHPTWVSVKADGHLLAQQQFQAGTKELWKAHKQFELIVAKPAQVDVLLNGQSISPFAMAHQGRLIITHSSVKPLPDSSR